MLDSVVDSDVRSPLEIKVEENDIRDTTLRQPLLCMHRAQREMRRGCRKTAVGSENARK